MNLSKTGVMVFNYLKTSHLHFSFKIRSIEIVSIYTSLGVKFSSLHFSMKPPYLPRFVKGMGSLARLESKLSLLDSDWALVERIQTHLLYQIIR